MKNACGWILAVAAAAAMSGYAGWNSPPPLLVPCQGRVEAQPPVNGTKPVVLRLYDALEYGNLLYEDSNDVVIVDSLYTTFMGDHTTQGTLTGALAHAEIYLEVEIDGDVETPRHRVGSTPYALLSAAVAQGSIGAAQLADGTVGPEKIACTAPAGGLILYYDGTQVTWAQPADTGVVPDGHSLDTADGGVTDVVYVAANVSVGVGTTNPVGYAAMHIARNCRVGPTPQSQLVLSSTDDLDTQMHLALRRPGRPDALPYGVIDASHWTGSGETNYALELNHAVWIEGDHDVGVAIVPPKPNTRLHVAMDTPVLHVGSTIPPPYAQLTLSGETDPDRQLRIGFNNYHMPPVERHGFVSAGFWPAPTGAVNRFPLKLNGAVWIAADKDVGIDTIDPDARLHVSYDGGTVSPGILVESPDYATIDLGVTGGRGATWRLQSDPDGRFSIWKIVGQRGLLIDDNRRVVVGPGDASAQLTVSAPTNGAYNPLQVFDQQGHTCLEVWNNEGVSIGSGGYEPPPEGLYVKGVLELDGGSDIAEPFDIADDEEIPAGTVVVINPDRPGALKVSDTAYDRRVAGVVSGAGGVRPGLTLAQADALDGDRHVALAGRVYARCDASFGPIEPGDLLTSSPTPGHAMRVADYARAQGATLGKAMSGLKTGKGLVLVLVTLQ